MTAKTAAKGEAAKSSAAPAQLLPYVPPPRIMWKLSRKDATRIACHCGRPARFGHTADGGAPYVYDCSKHVPVGVPIQMCANSAELVAAVEAKNEIYLRGMSAKKRAQL